MGGPTLDLLGSAVGCASGQGYAMGTNVWACPGAFSAAKPASSICSADFKPCVSNSGITLSSSCANPPVYGGALAYYFADIPGNVPAGTRGPTGACGISSLPTDTNMWFGCGRQGAAYSVDYTMGCSGFTFAAQCTVNASPLHCTTESTLDMVTNADPNSGVLCCSRAVQ